MKPFETLFLCILLVSCGAADKDPGSASEENQRQTETPAEEPPMFNIDPSAKGPLTMEELQLDLPSELESELSRSQQACFFKQVEEMVAEAGDPETLDPTSVTFLNGQSQWPQLAARAKRAILAQALTSEAIQICLFGR